MPLYLTHSLSTDHFESKPYLKVRVSNVEASGTPVGIVPLVCFLGGEDYLVQLQNLERMTIVT